MPWSGFTPQSPRLPSPNAGRPLANPPARPLMRGGPCAPPSLPPLRSVTVAQYGWMALGALLANVLGSLFYLRGLALTSVPATAIMHRLESVDFLLASALFLGDRPSLWVLVNGLLTVLGVVRTLVF
jgi:drug/metabolite transporter (DMT)-like permease